MAFNIRNVSMTGSEQEVTIADQAHAVLLQANGGDITIADETGGDTVTIFDKASLTLNTRECANKTLYVDGAAGTLEIVEITGGAWN